MMVSPVLVQRLDDGAQVQRIGLHAEDAHAAHAVQRLEDDVLVLRVEGAHVVGAARDQRGAHVLRELHDRELFRVVAQRARLVEHPGALALGLLQQVRGVEVFAVKRRVLAHETASNSASGMTGVLVSLNQSSSAPVSVMLRTVPHTMPPDRHTRCRGSHAAMRWPRRWASRIMENVVSL
jgi:hypothetical protein